jgi:hypothetical protein
MFLACLAAAFEVDIQIHCFPRNGKESAVEHIISSNYYAHHIIGNNTSEKTFESLKPARRARAAGNFAESSELESATQVDARG